MRLQEEEEEPEQREIDPEAVLAAKAKKWQEMNKKRYADQRRYGFTGVQKEDMPREHLRKIIRCGHEAGPCAVCVLCCVVCGCAHACGLWPVATRLLCLCLVVCLKKSRHFVPSDLGMTWVREVCAVTG